VVAVREVVRARRRAAPEPTRKTVERVYDLLGAHRSEGLLLASALAGGHLIVTRLLEL
jgi:hypothetical protein